MAVPVDADRTFQTYKLWRTGTVVYIGKTSLPMWDQADEHRRAGWDCDLAYPIEENLTEDQASWKVKQALISHWRRNGRGPEYNEETLEELREALGWLAVV